MPVHTIKVPDIGEGIAEVELVAWHVKPGDDVSEDQVLAEVMTDKATVEVPSPVHGKVLSLGAEMGQTIAVGAELIRLELPQSVDDAASMPQSEAAELSVQSSQAVADRGGSEAAISPPGRPTTDDEDLYDGQEHAPLHDPTVPQGMPEALHGKPLASPSVRRHARELGLALADVQGSGPEGRITHADLLTASGSTPVEQASAAQTLDAQQGSASGDSQVAAVPPSGGVTPDASIQVIPLVGLRRQIARNMETTMQHVAHFTYVEEVDMTEVETLRKTLNEQWEKERSHLTILPFLIRAMVMAIKRHPEVNAHIDEEAFAVRRYAAVHMGIAADTSHGLLVPVIKNAQDRSLWALAAEIARLSAAAKDGHARREELSGSTISLTSLGPLGGIMATPIVNYPEIAIVGVNRLASRPMAQGGNIVLRQMMNLSASFDHRIVDGALAARFVREIKRLLECPALLFLE